MLSECSPLYIPFTPTLFTFSFCSRHACINLSHTYPYPYTVTLSMHLLTYRRALVQCGAYTCIALLHMRHYTFTIQMQAECRAECPLSSVHHHCIFVATLLSPGISSSHLLISLTQLDQLPALNSRLVHFEPLCGREEMNSSAGLPSSRTRRQVCVFLTPKITCLQTSHIVLHASYNSD
jgi:hypothetical protein